MVTSAAVPSTSELAAAFSRQRRSLMLTSVVLALYTFAQVRLEKLNVLGNTFDIGSPGGVRIALWVLWAYFIVRFLQHRHDLADAGPRQAFRKMLERRMSRRAKRAFETRHPLRYAPDRSLSNVAFHYETISAQGTPRGPWKVTFRGSMTYEEGSSKQGTSLINDLHETVIPTSADRFLASIEVMARTRYFTEYYLPLMIAMLPIGAWLWV